MPAPTAMAAMTTYVCGAYVDGRTTAPAISVTAPRSANRTLDHDRNSASGSAVASGVTALIAASLIGRYRRSVRPRPDRVAQPRDRDRRHRDPTDDQTHAGELRRRRPLTEQHHAQPDRHDRLDEQDQRGHDRR